MREKANEQKVKQGRTKQRQARSKRKIKESRKRERKTVKVTAVTKEGKILGNSVKKQA